VVGDLISPFKAAMGAGYKAFEMRIQRAVHIRFGLPAELPSAMTQLIKKADKVAAYYEATQLAGFEAADAKACFGDPSVHGRLPEACRKLDPLPASEAQAAYIARFEALEKECREAPAHAS
jgi:uncharacterized protein